MSRKCLGLYSSAAQLLAAAQLEVDPPAALQLLQRVRAHVMHHGSADEVARLQLAFAKCRLASLPPYSKAAPPSAQTLQAHVLPPLQEALEGFGKLRAHTEAAEAAYLASRVHATAGATAERDAAAEVFVAAERAATLAAQRPLGRLADYAAEGVLEAHLAELAELDAAEAAVYAT